MAVICNIPGKSAKERINELRNIQSQKPFPNCNICNVPGETAKERINELHKIRNKKNQVPGDTFSSCSNNSSVKNESFIKKFKNIFK